MYKKISKCRVCDSKKIVNVVDFGQQPLANGLLKNTRSFRKEKKIPLEVVICQKCKLLQLLHTVQPKVLFRKYLWVTGTSNKVRSYREFFYKRINKYLKKKENFVCEVASNDGYFLEDIKKNNEVLGIDPAKNLAKIARKKGIETLTDFFNLKTSKKIIKLKKKNQI